MYKEIIEYKHTLNRITDFLAKSPHLYQETKHSLENIKAVLLMLAYEEVRDRKIEGLDEEECKAQ